MKISLLLCSSLFVFLAGCDLSKESPGQSDRLHSSVRALLEKDSEKSVRLRKELAEEGNVFGIYLLASINFYGLDSRLGYNKDVQPNPERAIELLDRIPEYALPQYLKAKIMLSQGNPKSRDYARIVKLLEASSKSDEGQSLLASLYLEGVVIPQNLDRAKQLLREQADYGLENDQARLAWLLASAPAEKEELIEALSWLYVLSEKGHTTFSEFYYDAGFPASFSSLINQEYPYAGTGRRKIDLTPVQVERVANLYENLPLVSQLDWRTKFDVPLLGEWRPPSFGDAGQSMAFLEKAALDGDPRAQHFLAKVISGGSWYTSTDPLVNKWLQAAASKDYPPSMGVLAMRVGLGFLENKDLPFFMEKLTGAAAKGDLYSQYLLGEIQTSQVSETVTSQLGMGRLDHLAIRQVYGVFEKNHEKTMLWRKVYRQQQLEILEHVRQRIEARLTEKELHQARELANSWKKRKFLNSIMSEGLYLGEYHIFNALILSTMLLLGYLSILTITANPREPKNQLISLILIIETLIIFIFLFPAALYRFPGGVEISNELIRVVPALHLLFHAGLLCLAGFFPSFLSRPFSNRYVQKTVLFSSVLIGVVIWSFDYGNFFTPYLVYDAQTGGYYSYFGNFHPYLLLMTLLINAYFVAVLVSSSHNKQLDSKERSEIRSYLTAYGFKFGFTILTVGFISSRVWFGDVWLAPSDHAMVGIFSFTGELLYGVLFAFGILRSQIFGIEQLFKRNLVRAMLLGSVIVVFIISEQLVENLISDEYGSIGGLMVAFVMLAIHRPIMKFFRGIVDRIIPDQDVIKGDASKVYAYQYEIAMNDGELSKRELDMLRLTAKSLGLTKSQAKVIEQQFAAT